MQRLEHFSSVTHTESDRNRVKNEKQELRGKLKPWLLSGFHAGGPLQALHKFVCECRFVDSH